MDRFQIEKNIGHGAQAVAYLARYRNDPNRYVVLKRLSIGSVSSQEMALMLKLRHPNIVRCYEAFTHQDFLYLVLQYAEGGDLELHLSNLQKRKDKLPIATLVSWFCQLCAAVQHCHDNKIIHRDIKSSNVFLSKDLKTIYLGDFGVAKELSESKSLTTTLVGSPLCLSPEVISGNAYSTPSDAWSLGCILYEMASLRRPFSSANFAQLVTKVCSAQYDPLPTDTPAFVVAAVNGLLALDTTDRWTVMQAAGSNEIFVAEQSRLEEAQRSEEAQERKEGDAAPTLGSNDRSIGGKVSDWSQWKMREISEIQRMVRGIGSTSPPPQPVARVAPPKPPASSPTNQPPVRQVERQPEAPPAPPPISEKEARAAAAAAKREEQRREMQARMKEGRQQAPTQMEVVLPPPKGEGRIPQDAQGAARAPPGNPPAPKNDPPPPPDDGSAERNKQRQDLRSRIKEQRAKGNGNSGDFSLEIVLPNNLKHLLQ